MIPPVVSIAGIATVVPPTLPTAAGFDAMLASQLPAAEVPEAAVPPCPVLAQPQVMRLPAPAPPAQVAGAPAVTFDGADPTSTPAPRNEDSDATDTDLPADDRGAAIIVAAPLVLPPVFVAEPARTTACGPAVSRSDPPRLEPVRQGADSVAAGEQLVTAAASAPDTSPTTTVTPFPATGQRPDAVNRAREPQAREAHNEDRRSEPASSAASAALPQPLASTVPPLRLLLPLPQTAAADDPRNDADRSATVDPLPSARAVAMPGGTGSASRPAVARDDPADRQIVTPPAPARASRHQPVAPPTIVATPAEARAPIAPVQMPLTLPGVAHVVPKMPAADPASPSPRLDAPRPDVAVATAALGDVSATVTPRTDGERLHVHFAVDREATAALITDANDGLDRALAAAGSTLDTVSVEVRGDRAAATSGGGGAPGQREPAHDQPRRSTVRPPAPPARIPAARRDRFA